MRHAMRPPARPWARLWAQTWARPWAAKPSVRAGAVALVAVLGFTSFAAAGASQPPPVATCASVAIGSQGQAVRTLQQAVGATPDGDFGPLTQKAVTTWQKAHHVTATGVVDAATWKALPSAVAIAACGQQARGTGVASTCTTLGNGATGPAVAVLQTALRTAGHPVTVDAQLGPKTVAAVTAVQTARKLKPTGIADAATWAALGLTGTPVCILAIVAPKPPADAAQQAKIRADVVKLAAKLPSTPGTSTNKIALAALAFAKAQAGKPYKWGGVGPSGYDCSGLVMASYFAAGLTLPRVAADQYGSGTTVPLDQVQQGDLLFYASDVAKPATIYHVAMYAGAGVLVDAPYTGAYVGTRPVWTRDLLPVAWRPVAPLVLPTKPGATGWTVTQLQQALDRQGAKLAVDGAFGPATTAAVKSWQQQHKLTANAIVDVTTWLTLGPPPPPPPVKATPTPTPTPTKH